MSQCDRTFHPNCISFFDSGVSFDIFKEKDLIRSIQIQFRLFIAIIVFLVRYLRKRHHVETEEEQRKTDTDNISESETK